MSSYLQISRDDGNQVGVHDKFEKGFHAVADSGVKHYRRVAGSRFFRSAITVSSNLVVPCR